MSLFALLDKLLLRFERRLLFVVVGTHVAIAFAVVAAGALLSRLLKEDILVRLDLDLLVLERSQDAGASSGERLLLFILEHAGRWCSALKLRLGGRLLVDVGLAPFC
jgi:hypothetical protein